MSLINKMNVGNTNYDIQDRLMPDAIGQAGQVLKVKDDGSSLEFSTIESGGGKVYSHFVRFVYTSVMFYSSRPTAYTFSDIKAYIASFEKGTFIAVGKVGNSLHAHLYDFYLELSGNNIEVWYSASYTSDQTTSKVETSLFSDTVTEI